MATDPVEILNQRNAEVAKIRGFADLTDEAKERRIAEVSERARAQYAEALEAGERESAERLQKSERAVFRVPVSATATDAEEAQIHAAYRAAWGDVYSCTHSPESPGQAQGELERILGQAERTGDKLLARAAYHRAIDLGAKTWWMLTSPRGRRRAGRGSPTPRRTRRLVSRRVSGASSSAV